MVHERETEAAGVGLTPSGSRRDEILFVALELFDAKGYDATTTREITDRLLITPAALYYHFPSKAACLRGIVEPYIAEVETVLERFGGELASHAECSELLAAYQHVIASNRLVARLVDRDPAVRGDDRLGPRLEALTARLLGLLAGPEPDSTDLVRASAALGAIRRPALRFGQLSSEAAHASTESALAAWRPPQQRRAG